MTNITRKPRRALLEELRSLNIVAALECAAGISATLVGKPNPEFYRSACRSLGLNPDEVLAVGDDLESDILGANNAGIKSLLVRTSKFQQQDLEQSNIRPDLLVNSIAELPKLLSID